MVEYECDLPRDWSFVISSLVHNRCAEFLEEKRKAKDDIENALTWAAVKMKNDGRNGDDVTKEKLRQALVAATKRYCFSVCAFYQKTNAWEPLIVDDVIRNADKFKWLAILTAFENGYKWSEIRRQRDEQAAMAAEADASEPPPAYEPSSAP
jgi:hypothetical protein